jgi:carbon-monoxide dehydrogenase large subunit
MHNERRGYVTTYFGAKQLRVEDGPLVRGLGRFVDDIEPEGTLHVAFVRSPLAHGRITGIDVSAIADRAGVEVMTAADVAHVRINQVAPDLPTFGLLADDEVRYLGHAVAAVFAPDRHLAHDAAGDIWVDYDELPAAIGTEAALRPDAPRVFGEMDSNVAFVHEARHDGDVFEGADVIVECRINNHRMAPSTLETRGILAIPDGDDPDTAHVTVYCSHQMPHRLRDEIAANFGIDEERLRLIAPDVGGGFGAKGGMFYPEYHVVVAAALRFGRPVKYIETRSENLALMCHARAQDTTVKIGATRDGRIVGLEVRTVGDAGAAALNAFLVLRNTRLMAAGCYDIPRLDVRVTGVLTHTVPVGAFRGAGRPEAAYNIERIMDHLARELEMDPAEPRRRNFVRPDAFPHTTRTGAVYDSGEYEKALEVALERVGYEDLRRAQANPPEGRLLGIGIASYVEVTARGSEFGEVELHPDGTATVHTGASPHGQGHETTWAQIVADALGVRFGDITVVHSDTDGVARGWGTAGSRSAVLAGNAAGVAARNIAGRLRIMAADRLEAAAQDIVLRDGRATVAGTDVGVAIAELAAEAGGFDEEVDYEAEGAAYPFGTHVCVVGIDTETGRVEIEKFVSVDDIGTVINPIITEGQIHAGVAHGATHALFEEVLHDEAGVLLTGNWATYHMPTISEAIDVDAVRTETPSPFNPLGLKGVGEPGTTGATPAVANAVLDALAPLGITDEDLPMPFTPDKVWAVLRGRT